LGSFLKLKKEKKREKKGKRRGKGGKRREKREIVVLLTGFNKIEANYA
jgi:hypothetical protein